MPTEMRTKTIIRSCELRDTSCNEENGDMILEGYAAVFDSPTVLYEIDGIQYKEILDREAFSGAEMKDCCMKYNHADNALLLARTRGGSLKLSIDNIGLKFKAKLFNTTFARDIYTLVKEGGLDKCSFAFTVNEDDYDRKTRTRTIKQIKELYDVSVVDVPAYDDTSVVARSYFELVRENERTLEREKLANELLVRTYL